MNDVGRVGSFVLAMAATLAIAVNAYVEAFHPARLGVVLAILLAIQMLFAMRVLLPREAIIYGCFLGYMCLELLWTRDRLLALNTLVPAATFLVALLLFSSLAAFHDLKAVIAGALTGLVLGAANYSRTSGFPFAYPEGFSYNAIAVMYLFGLLVALLLASIGRRKILPFAVAALLWIHVVATTSIKTNLGILLGAATAATLNAAYFSRLLWRNALVIAMAAALLVFAVASNESAVAMIERGTDRVALGLQILQARENIPGYDSFNQRADWQRAGFRGWLENPVFGHGVESFRSRFGSTSHASHVDIAYNSGLIGIVLFYSVLVSVLFRLYRARSAGLENARLVILGGVTCAIFISFAGTVHYGAFLAAFLGLAIGILRRA